MRAVASQERAESSWAVGGGAGEETHESATTDSGEISFAPVVKDHKK